ncbi:20S rRNA accumulation protein 4 [Trichomonascus vanleenenianus]|uniref:small subunit rRNA maturation protein TSR4 n=1 Tax=Trichomonascus vanleenenianus TaxID=2268995 RepID=UPI003ECBAC41
MSDSDFSDSEETQAVGRTSVLLGFADEQISSDEVTVSDDHLGGQPVWLHPESPPDEALVKCKNCNEVMPLLVQLTANPENAYYLRQLYVFACPKFACQRTKGSIRSLVGVLRNKDRENELEDREREKERAAERKALDEKLKIEKLGESIFSQPSSTNTNPFASSNPFASANPFDQTPASKEEKPQDQQEEEEEIDQFAVDTGAHLQTLRHPQFTQSYYLDFEDEVLKRQKEDPLVAQAREKLLNASTETDEPDVQQQLSSAAADMIKMVEDAANDKTFQNFCNIVSSNSDQILRYNNALSPLLFSGNDEVAKQFANDKLPNKASLELQVMPFAIEKVEGEPELGKGMEWGSIFVATAPADDEPSLDGNHVGYSELWVGVQWEDQIELKEKQ